MTQFLTLEPPALTDCQFHQLANIVRRESGIVLTTAKRSLLAARLNRRLNFLKLAGFNEYCDWLAGKEGPKELRHLLSAVTTNVTAFFREAHHFKALANEILPPLIKTARNGARIRLWSSACSSGEEAYSIAMTLLELCPEAASLDIRILATDIDPEMIARASAGRYPSEAVQPLGAKRLLRYFHRDENHYSANADLHSLIHFAELNLHDDWPFSGHFNVIFCRNVVIYFDAVARQKLWLRFARQLCHGGHLLIGHSERLDGPANKMFQPVGATGFRRVGALSPTCLTGD